VLWRAHRLQDNDTDRDNNRINDQVLSRASGGSTRQGLKTSSMVFVITAANTQNADLFTPNVVGSAIENVVVKRRHFKCAPGHLFYMFIHE
jgi:hypothetical protein